MPECSMNLGLIWGLSHLFLVGTRLGARYRTAKENNGKRHWNGNLNPVRLPVPPRSQATVKALFKAILTPITPAEARFLRFRFSAVRARASYVRAQALSTDRRFEKASIRNRPCPPCDSGRFLPSGRARSSR